MKRLNELIKCKYNIPIYGIKTNSKKIKKGDLFIAVHGYNCDHHAFISEAVTNGASAIISEKKVDVDKLLAARKLVYDCAQAKN